jgi:hypothetical protein
MTDRQLRSRSCSRNSRAGSIQGDVEDSANTEFSQVGDIMPTEIQNSEIIIADPDRGTISNDNDVINPSSNDQSKSVSQDQLKYFLNTVMLAIKESANQTAALVQEESQKQTAVVQEESQKQTAESARQISALVQEESRKQTAESAKLASAIQNLRSEIRKEN